MQETFKALSDPTRREILELLKERRMTAGEIASHFQMTNATVSHHLAVLRKADLISDDRDGKYIYYELNMSVFSEMLGWALGFVIEKEKGSIGMLQRYYKIGFNRAGRIMDQLADAGVVGPELGTKPRKILMTAEEFEEYLKKNNL